MIRINREPYNEKLQSAQLRLARLEQLQADARAVMRRREVAFRQAEQEGWNSEKQARRYEQSIARYQEVTTSVLQQRTEVRHIMEGW